ncbi:MAG: hypothetical protein JSS61_04145, partial [Verrucomicrobia bacterium]|nr:hypothetical protein [Verrucomicrobiota bacterium]
MRLSCIALIALSLSIAGLPAEEAETKTELNFLRDVMQPIGVPVVTAYHSMRENLFLNAKMKDHNPIESIGDFFL